MFEQQSRGHFFSARDRCHDGSQWLASELIFLVQKDATTMRNCYGKAALPFLHSAIRQANCRRAGALSFGGGSLGRPIIASVLGISSLGDPAACCSAVCGDFFRYLVATNGWRL